MWIITYKCTIAEHATWKLFILELANYFQQHKGTSLALHFTNFTNCANADENITSNGARRPCHPAVLSKDMMLISAFCNIDAGQLQNYKNEAGPTGNLDSQIVGIREMLAATRELP